MLFILVTIPSCFLFIFFFQVNRSSLLVPEQVTKPQEVNGTNGKAALPIADAAAKGAEHSSDSEQDEAGDTDEPGNSKSQSTFELNKRNNVFFKCLKENVQIIFNAENSFTTGIYFFLSFELSCGFKK